jgi:hypothetical protein
MYAGHAIGYPATSPERLRRILLAPYRDLIAHGGDVHNISRVRGHLSNALKAKTVALLTGRELSRFREICFQKSCALHQSTGSAMRWALHLISPPLKTKASISKPLGGSDWPGTWPEEGHTRAGADPIQRGRETKPHQRGQATRCTAVDQADSGQRWKQSDHSRLFRRAVLRAALDSREVTLYALRHSSIVRDLLANIPVRIVATKHDTSIPMIERNYSKYIADHADVLSRRAMLDPGAAPSDPAVPRPSSDQPRQYSQQSHGAKVRWADTVRAGAASSGH